ncbi:GNAT family N-acetyltransferase [Psychrobacillus sp. INOP01]|uniref:GNAT family N-acetyltransferase n=1 Tax=Psychrobacillus sp. INOP01 TaxID=2829187 RepID=UPI001BAA9D95|nr:GNAT family N-acetyltransferase [Psychrobacillus sp. INOP01]QUG42553.1 GNAT family N-acetyltransferase [Psychrobacillus sp. INOP01]
MKLISIKSYSHLEVYKQDWNKIMEDNENTNPFIEYEFVYNWWRILGYQENVEIIAIQEHNRMIAFFPFQFKKTWYGYMANFLALGIANYMDIIVRKSDASRSIMFALDELIKMKKSIVFSLHGLLESTVTPFAITQYLNARNMKERHFSIITPYINLEQINFDEYMKTRKKLHGMDRRDKRLRALGDVSLKVLEANEMDEIVRLHKRRWEKKNDTSGFSSESKQEFFRYLAELPKGKFSVRLTTLQVQEEKVAFTYGFTCRTRYLGYVLGHDSDFDCYGPGRLLIKEKVSQLISDGFQKLDMSIGYEPYKMEWNTDVDYTRKSIFSTNNVRAKTIRNTLWIKNILISKVKKYRAVVLFRRNTIGKVRYFLRQKGSFSYRGRVINTKLFPFIYDKRSYVIGKISNFEEIEDTETSFTELSPNAALSSEHERKDILQRIYNGYAGFYSEDLLKAFWVNENVIRLDSVGVVLNLKKRSIYINDWKNENIIQILGFVKHRYKGKDIFVSVHIKDKESVNLLTQLGFQWTDKVTFTRVLGKSKISREEY